MKKLNLEVLEKNINDVAKYDLDNKKVFGSAYSVCQGGKTVFEKCYGKTGLMGSDVAPRKDFIYKHAKEAEIDA